MSPGLGGPCGERETLALAHRVHTYVDPRVEAEFPEQMSGCARVRGRGETHERFVRVPLGEPERFPDETRQRAKFDALVSVTLDAAARERLVSAIRSLDTLPSMAPLFEAARA